MYASHYGLIKVLSCEEWHHNVIGLTVTRLRLVISAVRGIPTIAIRLPMYQSLYSQLENQASFSGFWWSKYSQNASSGNKRERQGRAGEELVHSTNSYLQDVLP